jgi:predicted lipid-binding transport protein (Tim44 family)
MADDLLNSMLGGSDDEEDNSSDLGDLLSAASSAPGAAKGAGADALGGLGGMLGGGGGGDLTGMLGALTGGGGGAMGMLGGLMGGSGGADFSQMPVVGPIISSLAEKFGIPPAQASALVTSALTMLMSQMKRSGASRVEEIDIGAVADEATDQADLIAQAAKESGLDEEQAAAGVQEALQMLAQEVGG